MYVDFIDFENRLSSFSDLNNSNQEEALEIEKLFIGELFGENHQFTIILFGRCASIPPLLYSRFCFCLQRKVLSRFPYEKIKILTPAHFVFKLNSGMKVEEMCCNYSLFNIT
ncbi:MAG: hypothetical protein APF81_14545 [Desulfosporosinus sp. BRH_c37]|nr:MAG: hypothetical protein APF81_14545 [Desulfosporosinus sp. BRH_c37]